MAFTKAEMKSAIETLWVRLRDGDTDQDIMDLMGVEPEDYESARRAMLDEQAHIMRSKPPEHHYVEYVIWQIQAIKDLTELVNKLKDAKTPNASAMVAAIKVRSDIHDKLIAKGQEFGVLKKAPDSKTTIGVHVLADLTNDGLRTKITSSVSELSKLMDKYGDGSILDVETGPLHHGPKLVADSAIDVPSTVIVAPPAKDDMINKPAKEKASGPRSDLKGKSYKSKKPPLASKIRGVKSAAIKDEIRHSRAVARDPEFD